MSPDAAKIMTMPAAQHPWLTAFCRELAAHPRVLLNDARVLVDVAMRELNLNDLDIEMLDAHAVSFAASSTFRHGDHFQEEVSDHVRRLLNGEAR